MKDERTVFSSFITISDSIYEPVKSPVSSSSSSSTPLRRPLNAFNLFFQEQQPLCKISNPDMSGNQISAYLGKEWKSMSEEARKPYYTKAQELMDKFKAENPDYHYNKKNPKLNVLQRLRNFEYSDQVLPNPLEWPELFGKQDSSSISNVTDERFEELKKGGQVSLTTLSSLSETIISSPNLFQRVSLDFASSPFSSNSTI